MNRNTSFVLHLVIVLMLAVAMTTAGADAQTKINPGYNLFTPEQDVEIGQQSAAEAEAQLPMVNDRDVEAYVNEIGQRLAAQAGGPQFRYQFRVVNASDINAFALPGGFIYINRGILEGARNEGEVAGVVAHEIAHVALRHGTHQASKAYGAQAGLSILGALLGGKVSQGTAGIINAVGGFGMNVLFLKYSREAETQADVRGAQILAAAGYSPADMVGFFKTLERLDRSQTTTWLSNHPAPPDRIARIQQEAKLLRVSAQPTQNVASLSRIQSRLRGLGGSQTMAQIASGQQPAATSRQPTTSRRRSNQPSSGSASPSVAAPSTSLRSYTNRAGLYRISYPSNWKVYEDGSSGVTMAPEGGIGSEAGRTEIVYGAVVNHYSPFGNVQRHSRGRRGSSDEISVADATNDLIAQIIKGSSHLRTVRGSGRQIRTSGSRALTAILRGANPNTGVQERVTVVTRQLADDHLIYLLFITPERDVKNYNGLLEAMVNSMQVDEERHH